MNYEDIPYRTAFTEPDTVRVQTTSKDEDNYDTLKSVYKVLNDSLLALDKWSAFDLREQDGLSLKQQIKAHQLAYDILAPLVGAVESAVALVDDKYKER